MATRPDRLPLYQGVVGAPLRPIHPEPCKPPRSRRCCSAQCWASTWAFSGPSSPAPTPLNPSIQSQATAPSSEQQAPPTRESYLRPILARPIFDSSKVGTSLDDASGVALSPLDLVLLGTTIADPPALSSALIAQQATPPEQRKGRHRVVIASSVGPSHGYGIGDTLADDAVIVAIERGRVLVERSDGSTEQLVFG